MLWHGVSKQNKKYWADIFSLTFVLFLDVRRDKVMKEEDDLCIHGNLDVVVKLCHEAALYHRLGVCG